MLPKTCPACKQKSVKFDDNYLYCTNCPLFHQPLNFWQEPLAWAETKIFWWRLPIYAWFISLLISNWRNNSFALSRMSNPFSALDFGIHELGHMIFMFFGQFMHIAGGSLFQCIFPLLWMIGFIQKKWYFAATMCWCWLGLNLFDVATYAADARARLLPLATGIAGLGEQGSDDAYDQAHDWYQLLSRTGHLQQDLSIAHGLRAAATISFIIGLGLGLVLVFYMLAGSIQKLRNK